MSKFLGHRVKGYALRWRVMYLVRHVFVSGVGGDNFCNLKFSVRHLVGIKEALPYRPSSPQSLDQLDWWADLPGPRERQAVSILQLSVQV
jgi:hypothetical protein